MRSSTLYLLMLVLLLSSCSEKDGPELVASEVTGEDTISLSVNYTLDAIGTRVAVDETLVENVNLYIVNEKGDLVTYDYIESGRSVDVVICRDMKYKVYVIANAGCRIPAGSVEEIEGIICRISSAEEMVSRNGAVLMSGKTGYQSLADGQQVMVTLVRCVSKIVLKCDWSGLNPDVDIVVRSVGLRNVPKCVKPFGCSMITDAGESTDGLSLIDPDRAELERGVAFYQYENMQGVLLPDNLLQSAKVWPDDHINASLCSYIEVKATYTSPKKEGEITYRFYLGTDMTTNFDVIRNTQHTITVNFKLDGAIEENTWRVDNSGLADVGIPVTKIRLSSTYEEMYPKLKTQLTATVYPADATNKRVIWWSSDASMVTVDSTGLMVAANKYGTCVVYAMSDDNNECLASCSVKVRAREYVSIVGDRTIRMKVGEQYQLQWHTNPEGIKVTFKSNNSPKLVVDQNGLLTAIGKTTTIVDMYVFGGEDFYYVIVEE